MRGRLPVRPEGYQDAAVTAWGATAWGATAEGGDGVLLGIWRYLAGTLDVTIDGEEPEQLVNLAVAEGLDLWHLRRPLPDRLEARMLAPDFAYLRPLCRQARCRVRIRRRRGWPFLQRRLLRRRTLLAGAVLSAATLLWALGHVWEIDVRGTRLVDPKAVQAGLYELGLRPGAWRSRLNPAALEQQLSQRVPEVGWAAIRFQGVRAVVWVVERVAYTPPANPGRVDLVADHGDCVVESVVVYQGQRRVQEGDYIRPGQLLIEGGLYGFTAPPMRLPYTKPEDWPPTPDKPLAARVARGQVEARCFHTEILEVPLVREERIPTGRTQRQLVLRRGSREIILLGRARPAGPAEVRRQTLGFAGWRNWLPPVELEMVAYDEVTIRREPVPEAEAVQAAVAEYLARLNWHLHPGTDRVVGQPLTEVQGRSRDRLRVRVVVQTRERVGRPQPAPGILGPGMGGQPDI